MLKEDDGSDDNNNNENENESAVVLCKEILDFVKDGMSQETEVINDNFLQLRTQQLTG